MWQDLVQSLMLMYSYSLYVKYVIIVVVITGTYDVGAGLALLG